MWNGWPRPERTWCWWERRWPGMPIQNELCGSSRACGDRGGEVRMASEAGAPTAGRFGPYGGRYVPETLMAALEEIDRVHGAAKRPPYGTNRPAVDPKSRRLNSSHV